MTGMRIAGGILAVAALTGATACTSPSQAAPATETLTPLVEQALPNVPGKTFTSTVVSFPPGARAVPHRHGEAFVYAYVLEGSVRSAVDDNPVTTYRAGENWVEQPGAHHPVTENASDTDPAKLLVVFVSSTGDRLKVDDHQ
ncbi:cupin domain-containing protein [Mycolicibacterium peregrinum]|uniref:Cupin domain-containing protein n=1 Tax=Mycolicibacterium peregrinum TaxID=43304 RepID=A0A4Z0HNW7_MYCPR|nr:cupin domain-containing protein [Mycolicibacterium peregrinum]TGB40404.1 cupin domain-containing protein [Mycolicibacterium peregrinum]TGB42864.1 cupin domain-containing protein [Mycolicibacterium peregrinum]